MECGGVSDGKIYGEHLDAHPDTLLERLRILGERAAKARAYMEYMEDKRKIIFADLRNSFLRDEGRISESALERMAYSHEAYKQHIEALFKARQESLVADVQYRAEDKKIELLRSLESSSRAQLQKS